MQATDSGHKLQFPPSAHHSTSKEESPQPVDGTPHWVIIVIALFGTIFAAVVIFGTQKWRGHMENQAMYHHEDNAPLIPSLEKEATFQSASNPSADP